jgi:hypothetical protein
VNCFYCGIELTKPPRGPGRKGRYPKGFRFPKSMWTSDHVVPRCKGGREKVPSCFECNRAKGELSLEEFRILIGYRLNFESWWQGTYRFIGEDSAQVLGHSRGSSVVP